MTASQVLIAHAVKILVLLTLAGILARRRWSTCWFFTAYLAVVLLCNSLVSFWPEHFYQPWFYLVRTGLYDGLKLAIAIELAYRTFQAFPGTQATARRVLFVLAIVSSALLMAVPWDGAALFEWEPRILAVSIWLLVLAVVVIWRYRVPIHAYPKAILLGFVPYLLVFAILLPLLRHSGWDILLLVQSAEPVAYLLVMGWWAWAAWQPASVRGGSDHGSTNRNSSGLSSNCGNAPSIPAPFGCASSERYRPIRARRRGTPATMKQLGVKPGPQPGDGSERVTRTWPDMQALEA